MLLLCSTAKRIKSMKRIKFGLIAFALFFAAYHSVYFEPLDKMRSQAQQTAFDPSGYAASFWNNQLMKNLSGAVDAVQLLDLFEADMKQAVSRYAKTLGIASTHAYLVKGAGRIIATDDEGLLLSVRQPENKPDILIQTDYIFGNAIRDASGLIHVSEFPSSMDFNSISVEINNIVKTHVVAAIRKDAAIGKRVTFIGATQVSEEEQNITPLLVVPIQVEIDR